MNDPIDDPRVAAHLAAVATALARGGDASAGGRILDDLRSHIRDAVQARAGADDPVAEVLATLDPPSDYGIGADPASAPRSPPQAPSGRVGWYAFLAAVSAPLAGIAVGLTSARVGDGGLTGWLVFCAIEFGAGAAGIAARRQPWARAAVVTALGMFAAPLVLDAIFRTR